MEISEIIAENLKSIRNGRNLSLGQLSEICGVSKVMLSQIEKGSVNPTINTILKISNGLNIPYTGLLEQKQDTTGIVRRSDISMQVGDNEHYRIYCYYPGTEKRNFELFRLELDAGHSNVSAGHVERAQEYIMVLSGELTMKINDTPFVVKPEECIHFNSSVEHTYISTGNDMLVAVIINFYPY